MKLNYLCLGLSLGISSCSNIATPESIAKSFVGHSIVTQSETFNTKTILVREVNDNLKEYEYRPSIRDYPSCIIIWTVDPNGIVKSYRLSGKCSFYY